MRFDAFFGGSYQSQAATADQERCINFYPEVLQSPGATAKTVLYPTPGVESIEATTVPGYGRGHFAWEDGELAAIGTIVYAVDSAGVLTEALGWAPNDGNPVTICGCPQTSVAPQYLVTSGGEASLIYHLGPGNWLGGQPGTITSMVGKSTMGGFLDGRFLILDANESKLYISAVWDGSSWTPGSDYAQRSLAPDPWRSMKVVGRYIWLFGEETTEIWQDTGANFPFAPFPSSLLPYGIEAPYSPALVGNGVVWLARTKGGKRCVVYASGQTPEIISTYPIETALSRHANVSTAVGDSYSENGHTFYLLSIDEEPETTLVWDLETKLWHERGTWRPELNRFEAWRPRYYAFANGEHRMLDKSGAGLYRMRSDLTSDVDGLAIRRIRRAPAIQAENKRVYFSSFELDVEPGLGLGAVVTERASMASFYMTKQAGRLLAIDDADWASNVNNGYTTLQAQHDVLLSDIVFLLTGKRTGANILIVAQYTTGRWGSQFTAGLTRLGHTYTQTMTASTLAGYVMGDFDMTVMLTLSGGDYALIDPYLDANGAILTALDGLNNSTWSRYGFASSATQWQTTPSGPLYNRPLTCAPLGRSPYDHFVFTSPRYVTATKTVLTGTTTLYTNDLGEYMAAIWEK